MLRSCGKIRKFRKPSFPSSFHAQRKSSQHVEAEELKKIIGQQSIKDIINNPSKVSELAKKVGVPESTLKNFLVQQELAAHRTVGDLYLKNLENTMAIEKKDPSMRSSHEEEPDPKGNFLENPKYLWWLGLLLVLYLATRDSNRMHNSDSQKDPVDKLWSDKTVGRISHYPTRFLSRLAGSLVYYEFPSSIQISMIKAFAWWFGCHLDEMTEPLESYKSLGAFFCRHIKEEVRPIDPSAQLVCPVDGRVVHYGVVSGADSTIEQCKGIDFAVQDFMGPDSPIFEVLQRHKTNPDDKKLYYCVIYLAPGDYHGYHSPVDWKITQRVHFPGHLFPVADWAVKFIRGLFAMNERVVLTGTWKHGFFSYSPIGAYNVGSMTLDFEKPEEFATNLSTQTSKSLPDIKSYETAVEVKKADNIGFFQLGSSVIMIFESVPVLFMVPRGEKVKLGEVLTRELTPEMAREQKERLLKGNEILQQQIR